MKKQTKNSEIFRGVKLGNESADKKTRVITDRQSLDVLRTSKTYLIGGKECSVYHFSVAQSKDMEALLNHRALVTALAPAIKSEEIDSITMALSEMVGGGSFSMQALGPIIMKYVMTPNATTLTGGLTSPEFTKEVVSSALMLRLKDSLPGIVPSILSSLMKQSTAPIDIQESTQRSEFI